MAVSTENAAAAIREWLMENVTGNREVSDDEALIENGVLTSLQTVELVMFLEDRFGVRRRNVFIGPILHVFDVLESEGQFIIYQVEIGRVKGRKEKWSWVQELGDS